MRMSVKDLITLLQQAGRQQLKGKKRVGFEAALMGVKAMRGMMESGLADMVGKITYREQRWGNVQAELQVLRRVLQKRRVRLSPDVQTDLDYYCDCSTVPGDY